MSGSKLKIGLKQILSGILTFMLVFTSIPITEFTTFAAEEHQVNGGSSRDLINAINSAGNGDAILINDTVNIDKKVTINKNITLKGKGTLLRAENFKSIMLNIGSNANVTIEEITIDGNNISDSTDSAVYINKNASFTMKSGTIKNNNADSGGGVYNVGTLTINGGAISGNKAKSYSGGVSNQSIFTMSGGTITGNSSDKDSGGVGSAGTFTMTGGIISGNTTKGNGGGIRNIGTLQMSGGMVKENNAQYGGGVYNQSVFKMTGGTISGNTASKLGGGLYSDKGTFEVQNTATIDGNDKNDNVMFASEDNYITVAGKFNGAIGLKQNFDMTAVKAANDYTITQDDASHFKADSKNDYLELTNNTLVYKQNIQNAINNASSNGGLVSIDSTVVIDKTLELKGNVALKGKGTLLRAEGFKGKMVNINSNANVTMEGITVDGNNIVGSTGSAVYINSSASFTMNSGKINNNTASTAGGVYNYNGTFTMNGGTISQNTASVIGGVYNSNGNFTMNGGTITGNSSNRDSGGVENTGKFKMSGGTISKNTAVNGGGINNCNNGTFTMTGGVISENTAKINGGGVYHQSKTFTMSGGTISKNTATNGGGVYINNTFKMTDGTISGNSASELAGGLYLNKGRFEVQDTAVINNNDKNDNVRVESSNYPIIVSGEYNGVIRLNSEFSNVVVKAADGYTMTQGDASCFKADGSDAYLNFVDNAIVYMKNRAEWGQMVHRARATYYVDENGRSSTEITGNGKVWLNTKLDGSGSWYCIDNSQGTFKVGSRFYVQVIDDISKYYDKIGSEYRDKIENGKLKIFLIGVTDPDGKEYINLDTDLNCYVKVDPNWDKDKLKAIFINGEKTEKIDVEYMGTIESPSSGDKFVKLTLNHFSPYAIYQAKSQENEAIEDSNLNNVFATGENVNYGYILGLSTMAIVALVGVIFIKKKFN